jgi:hypothetical protein
MLYALAFCVWVGTTPHCNLVNNNYSISPLFPSRQECVDLARRGNLTAPRDRPNEFCVENDTNGWIVGQGWRPVPEGQP